MLHNEQQHDVKHFYHSISAVEKSMVRRREKTNLWTVEDQVVKLRRSASHAMEGNEENRFESLDHEIYSSVKKF